MDGITLSFTDARRCWPRALEEQVRAAAPLLARGGGGRGAVPGQPGLAQCGRGGRAPSGWTSCWSRRRGCGPTPMPSWSSESAAPTRRPGRPSRPCGRRGAPPFCGRATPSPPARWPALCGSWTDINPSTSTASPRTLRPWSRGLPSGCCASTWSGATARRARQSASSLPARPGSHPPPALPRPGLYVPHIPRDHRRAVLGGQRRGALPNGGGRGGHPRAGAGDAGTCGIPSSPPRRRRTRPCATPACAGCCWSTATAWRCSPFSNPGWITCAKWWIQLFAESEGKEGNALYPVAASNSEDLHSIGQFIQEGSPILFETFVEVRARDASVLLPPEAKKDYFDYLTGMDFWDINNTARQATMRAHGDRASPA